MRCRELVLEASRRHDVPPAEIVAHVRTAKAVRARHEVMRAMRDMGLPRSVIAMAFGRDLRRVRCSVIGGEKGKTRVDYTTFDLFGHPVAEKPARPKRPRLEEAVAMLKLVAPAHPEVEEWLRSRAAG